MQTEETLSSNETQTELQVQKALELRKLALEIAELERPWWKRPNYILAALPTLLAIVALSVGFLNGFFSAQLTKLENQRHALELQVKEFETTKEQLRKENEQLKKDKQALSDEIASHRAQLSLLLGDMFNLRKQRRP